MSELSNPAPATAEARPFRRRRHHRWWHWCGQTAANVLYPPQCQFCGEEISERGAQILLCAACHSALAPLREFTCRRCAAPVPRGGESRPDCQHCQDTQFHFSSAVGLGNYHGELGDAVRRIKQPFHEPLALALGHLLASEVATRWPDFRPDMAVPIPMYWGRRWLRGHNGPELVAEAAAGQLAIPLLAGGLVCRRNHERQSTLSRAQRFTNMRGAFIASLGYTFAGTKILLVDDTLTTGATASEGARMLKEAGAAEVRVATVARTIGI